MKFKKGDVLVWKDDLSNYRLDLVIEVDLINNNYRLLTFYSSVGFMPTILISIKRVEDSCNLYASFGDE